MYIKLTALLVWLAFATTVQANAPEVNRPEYPTLKPLPQQAVAAQFTARLIREYHYKPVALDDALSEKIFVDYLKSLDPDKMLFVQADIDQLKAARTQLDDAVLTDNLGIPFAIFNLYARRAVERFTYARTLLKTGFDFQQEESYPYLREKASWAQSEAEMGELWRKRVKNDWLQLKLAGKDEQAIAQLLDKRYENFLKRIRKLKSEDAFQIFMNAFTMSVDPHTNYMGPRTNEEFDIAMKLSLVGIGAVLEEKDDYATIKALVPGGPAALSAKLKVGDRIAGVAQGDHSVITDVVGWRLDDTVSLIRGPVDSAVVLDVLPADSGHGSEHKRVELVRKKISLEDQAAKKSIFSLPGSGMHHRIGVISLPSFYEDFHARQEGAGDYRSATRDVSRLLAELKNERVDAVLMDLRDNGGGSLREAIELTDLFLGAKPVVQQRGADGEITIARGVGPGVAWNGPLGVLINKTSASASEIFAAAIQDYQRGLVIGGTSFGKGTVQTMISLDQIAHTTPPQLGDVKLTIAQFFRINGSTTQLRGVTPDIRLPTTSDTQDYGESSYDNPLPWMGVKAAPYHTVADLRTLLPTLRHRHQRRIGKDKDYQNLIEDIAEFNQLRKKELVSLNEAERRKERDAHEAKLKLREKDGAATEKSLQQAAAANANSRKDVEAELEEQAKKAKDVWLNEAASILGDMVDLLQEQPHLASQASENSLRAKRHLLR